MQRRASPVDTTITQQPENSPAPGEQLQTVLFVSSRLHAERLRRGTRTGTRALGCFKQAVLVIRWFLDGTRVAQLAVDNAIGRSTAYDYLHEGIAVLAAQAPSLHGALLAAKMAGYDHVNIDGTLIETDRCRTPGPTPGAVADHEDQHRRLRAGIQRPSRRRRRPGSGDALLRRRP